ncbi:hypothetical protein [Pimelobacter simplex]|uniref:hypothetical protein n=1 Tax=Nocardioides simplex TaxID=2045 RepID=UPI003AAF5B8C
MAGRELEFSTPWLRDQLIERLGELADPVWLTSFVTGASVATTRLDEVLDFLDDTGAVDEPENQVGAFLRGNEVERARSVGAALGAALGGNAPESWTRVAAAAERLLEEITAAPADERMCP